MNTVVRLLFLLSLLVLEACNQAGQNQGDNVVIKNSGIFNPVSLVYQEHEVQPVEDLGEYLLGTPKKTFRFQVRNNSLYPILSMKLELDSSLSFGFGFNKDQLGNSIYPGSGGTCDQTLLPGGVCDIVLQFETTMKGDFSQQITFKYKNLVEESSRPLKLIITAGNPASLIFDGDKTSFFFGDKVGLDQTPIVEKDDATELQQTLNVTNTGDLKARNVVIALTQDCVSKKTGSCPSGQNKAYVISHNCPTIIPGGDSCQVVVKYKPLNKESSSSSPNPDLANIRYDSAVRFTYLNSNEEGNNKAALNGFFTSTSANIEANFVTSVDSVPFEGQTVIGNRAKKSFRINNRGYREGKIRALSIVMDNVTIGYCVRSATSLVNCYTDSNLATLLPHTQFPFYFEDQNNCLGTSDIVDGKIVNVDSGCQFNAIFQPSITYLTDGTKSFSVKAEFDSQWKGLETIKTNFLFNSVGSYLTAAALVPESITYNSVTISPSTASLPVNTREFNLGRIAMMSSNSFKRSELTISFVNNGSVVADAIKASDGKGTVIPNKENSDTGVDLKPVGGDNKPMYQGAKINTSFCTQIPPGQRCIISINFAPIYKGDIDVTRNYMFDQIFPADILNSYKSILMSYKNGALYTDSNKTETPDILPSDAHAMIKASLIAKGLMDKISSANFSADRNTPAGQTQKGYIIMTNIGTDDIKYIGYTGLSNLVDPQVLAMKRAGYRIIDSDIAALKTKHSSTLFGDLIDCRKVIDFSYLSTNNCTTVQSRVESVSNPTGLKKIAPDDSCALTIEIYDSNYLRSPNAPDTLNGGELARNLINSQLGSEDIWSWPSVRELTLNLNFDYYDNDISNPAAVGNLKTCYGSRQVAGSVNGNFGFKTPARVNPHTPFPFSSAILYRKSFTLPAISEDGVQAFSSVTVPENWFFSSYNYTPTDSQTYNVDILRAFNSRNHVPANLPVGINTSDYEYVIHLGTFPTNKSVEGGFYLASMASTLAAAWNSHTFSEVLRPAASAKTFANLFSFTTANPALVANTYFSSSAYNSGVFSGTNPKITVTFNPDAPGVYASVMNYSFYNSDYIGVKTNPVLISKKILIIAEAVADAPDLSVQVADYQVATNGSTNADVTPTTPTGFVASDYVSYDASYGDKDAATTLAFNAIKVTSPTFKDFFVKRQIKITNTSTTQTLSELKFLAKASAPATELRSLSFGNNIKFCFNNSTPTYCTGTCTGTSLAPGGSCYFEVFYQPDNNQLSVDINIAMSYKMQANQYLTRNIKMQFNPFDPAVLAAVGATKESITTTNASIQSYPLDFKTLEFSSDPHTVAFDQSSGTYKRIQVTNSTSTRASFLKAWHDFRGITNVNTIPLSTDYGSGSATYGYTAGGVSYTQIAVKKYTDNSPRILVYATKPCLIGDSTTAENALPNFKRGFNNASTEICYLAVVLKADSNYQNTSLSTTKSAHMEPNHIRVRFYNNDRSSYDNFTVHFRGKFLPNGSIGSPNNTGVYKSVITDGTGYVEFKWSEMTPKNSSLGPIVGYRVFWSTNSSALADVYTTTITTRTDGTAPNGTGIYKFSMTLNPKTFYYFKIVAIRNYSKFKPATDWPGLNPFTGLATGNYLSDTGIAQMTLATPPTDMFYDHTMFAFISRQESQVGLQTFSAAKAECAKTINKVTLSRSGSSVSFSKRLITESIWTVIKNNPTQSVNNPYSKSLWLDGTTQNIHNKLLGYVGYDVTTDLKYLPDAVAGANPKVKIFYFKNTGCQPNCSGEKAVGTVYDQPDYAGYESFISTGNVFANPRCYIDLNTP